MFIYDSLSNDYRKLMTEILEKNIVGENIEQTCGRYNSDEENLTTSVLYNIHVDGEPHEMAYVIEHKDDFRIAEITEFSVDGEKIDL